jgi:hypothetical protein
MNPITNYDDIKIHDIQKVRLYMQGRPLISLWHRQQRKRSSVNLLPDLDLIDKELTGNFIALDCGGWYFANDTRTCTAVELDAISSKLWSDVYFEYDYLTWHPTYLPDWPVLAYYSTYFKYCELNDFVSFCQIWSRSHDMILALDPTKIKFNYLKYQLEEVIQSNVKDRKFNILNKDNFYLLCTLKKS